MDDALALLAVCTDGVGRWGDSATDLQWGDARAILDVSGPRRHWLGRAKGYSKTRDVAGMSLAALVTQAPVDAVGYAAAADQDQAGLVLQSVRGFVAGTPALAAAVSVQGQRVRCRSGAELVVLAADAAGSHGLRPWWLVADELANWPDTPRHREFFDSLWAGLPKVAGSRGIVMTTAGGPGHFARRVFEAAGGDPLWRVSDVHGPPPWADPVEVEAERRRLFPGVFARLWLNEWAAADDGLADPDDVAAACVLGGPLAPDPAHRYLVTLDIGTKNDRTAAVVAHAERTEGGTRVVVDRLQVWTPRPGAPVALDDVRLWVQEMCRAYQAPLHFDPSQGYLMADQLRQAGVACQELVFTVATVGRLAAALMQALRGRLLVLPDDEALRDEILAVRLRETSTNVVRIDHRSGGHDDRVIAVAMAVHLLTAASRSPVGDYLRAAAAEQAARPDPDDFEPDNPDPGGGAVEPAGEPLDARSHVPVVGTMAGWARLQP